MTRPKEWAYDPNCICDRCRERSQLLEPTYSPVGWFTLVCWTIAAAAIVVGVYFL